VKLIRRNSVMKKFISVFLSLVLIRYSTIPLYAKESGSQESLATIQTVDKTKSLGRVQATEKIKEHSKIQIIDKLNELGNSNLKLKKKDGQVFLWGKLSTKQASGDKSAIKFVEDNKLLFGIDNTTEDIKVDEIKKDMSGDTYVKFVQVIKGTKVKGSLINVHFDKNGVIVSVNGKLEKNKIVTTIGSKIISESEAIEIAQKQYTYKSLRNAPKAEKLIITKDDKNYEVFKVNISYTEPTIGNYDVFVEVHSGEVIQTENNIRASGVTTGSGIDVLGYSRKLNLYLYGTSYQMKDFTKTATGSIVTNSLNYGDSNVTLVSNNTNFFGTEDYKASVSAHYNAGKVIDFYKNLFNRNSLDDNGMPIKSFTHYGYKYNNAFWSGYEMVYGDGDGSEFTYLSGDLDIVGHEMTHGVIDNTANLQYHNESGALNESIADVFGVLISTYDKYNVASGGSWSFNSGDWVVGDDIYTPHISGDALRNLSKPTLYGQPDNMSNYKYYPDTEVGDYGGVHINSGIPSKAAYLIAKTIGMEKTARIYYRALVNYMSESTDFEEGKKCLMQAATDLYGGNSTEVIAVNNAFNSVGVGQPSVEDPYGLNDIVQSPVSLEAISSSYNSINIKWNEVIGASGYEVYRGASSTGVSTLISTITATSYNDTGLLTNSTYYYRVRAYKMVGFVKVYSDFTTEKSAKPIPATPLNFKATRVSAINIKLTWSPVTGANGYEVYSLLTRRKYLFYTNSGLIISKPYYYKIRSYRTVGTIKIYSDWTSEVSAKS
jgi:bacillolysin